MRQLKTAILTFFIVFGSSFVWAQGSVPQPRIEFLGHFGTLPPAGPEYGPNSWPTTSTGPSYFYTASSFFSLFGLDLDEKAIFDYYQEHFGPMTMSHKSIKGYRALVLDYVNPYFKKYGTETDFPPIRGIYLYKQKQLVGHHLFSETHVEYDFETDPLMMAIKALPSQTLITAPGDITIPDGVVMIEYDASTDDYIEKYLFMKSSKSQVLLTHSFYPSVLDTEMNDLMKEVMVQQLTTFKRWHSDK